MILGANFKFKKYTSFSGLLVWLEIRKCAPESSIRASEFPNRHTSSSAET
jgi:hypothetical protein